MSSAPSIPASPIRGATTSFTVEEILCHKGELLRQSLTAHVVSIVQCETYMHHSKVAFTAAVIVVVTGGFFAVMHVTVNTNIGAPALHGFLSPSAYRAYIAFISSEATLLGVVMYSQQQIKQLKSQQLDEAAVIALKKAAIRQADNYASLAKHLGWDPKEDTGRYFQDIREAIGSSSDDDGSLNRSMIEERLQRIESAFAPAMATMERIRDEGSARGSPRVSNPYDDAAVGEVRSIHTSDGEESAHTSGTHTTTTTTARMVHLQKDTADGSITVVSERTIPVRVVPHRDTGGADASVSSLGDCNLEELFQESTPGITGDAMDQSYMMVSGVEASYVFPVFPPSPTADENNDNPTTDNDT